MLKESEDIQKDIQNVDSKLSNEFSPVVKKEPQRDFLRLGVCYLSL